MFGPHLRVVGERWLIEGHTLYAVVIQEGKKPRKSDTLHVHCSCGERLTLSVPSQAAGALRSAERNHRRQVGWPKIAEWHGTPNGYVNHGCRCDPCMWAWASYNRDDEPVFPGPAWLDEWLQSGAPVPSFAPVVNQHYDLLTTTRGA